MARLAKNPRIRGVAPTEREPDRSEGRGCEDERRRGADRRNAARASPYAGPDRREGPRRSIDLPRPVWRRPIAVGLAIVLGVAAGLTLDLVRRPPPPNDQVRDARIDPELLAGVQTLRDQAEALTPAGVALDERAHELWMPRVAKIEIALADPKTPASVREHLDATLEALARVGVIQGE